MKNINYLVLAGASVIMGSLALGADPSVQQVLAATDKGHGLVVVAGTTDGALESAIAAAGKGDLIVSGVAIGNEAAAKARARIDKDGQAGYASVTSQPSLSALPYNGNLANVVVADLDKPGAPLLDEVLRVVHPYGSALVCQKGAWKAIVKPLPAEMDDWTHYDYGAAGNPQSHDKLVGNVRGLQWWVSSHAMQATTIRLAGGRRLQGVERSGAQVGRDKSYQARDAFNGLPLWRLDSQKDLMDYYPRQERLIAANGDIVVGLFKAPGFASVLDARTGEQRLELKEGLMVDESRKIVRGRLTPASPVTGTQTELHHLLIGGRIIQAQGGEIVSLDATTGKRQWYYKIPADAQIAYLAADEGVCVVSTTPVDRRFRMTYGNLLCTLDAIVGIDLATGKQLWSSDAAKGFRTFGILIEKGVVYVADSNPKPKGEQGEFSAQDQEYGDLLAVNAKDGKTLWKRDLRGVEPQDRFWHNKLRVQSGFVMPMFDKVVRGFDAQTGADGPIYYRMPRRSAGTGLGFCTVVRGTANGQVGGKFASFVDFATGEWDLTSMARGVCDEGQYPAYGMIHTGTDWCGCTSLLRGMVGLQCYQDTTAQPIPAAERLEQGVATPLTPDPANAWPMQFADPKRSSSSSSPLRLGSTPTVLATIKLPVPERRGMIGTDWADSNLRCGAITAPVVAGGLLVTAVTDAQSVHAFDAVSGAPRWVHRAAARIDSAPTLARGLVVFGTRDGAITALRASDGALVWRNFVATNRRQIVVDGQVESVFPVHGSVLVRDGKVYAAVGRHNQMDGGVRIVRLDLATGALQAETLIRDQATSEQPRIVGTWDIEGRLADLLTTNLPGTILYMGPIAIDPDSLAWASLALIPGDLGEGKKISKQWFTGPGPGFFTKGPDWSWKTPGILSFVYCPAAGAVDKRSGTTGIKGQNGWRMLANTAYQQGIGGDRVAVLGKEFIAARDGFLDRQELNDQWVPKTSPDMPFWKRHMPIGEKIVTNVSGIEALAVTPEQNVVAKQSNPKVASSASEVNILDRQGKLIGETIKLPKRIVANGLAIADGRLYVACEDGSIRIIGQK